MGSRLAEVCPVAERPRGTGVILGVARGADGVPLADASVRLGDRSGRIVETRTDDAGRFHFCDAVSGSRVAVTTPSGDVSRYVLLRSEDVVRLELRPGAAGGAAAGAAGASAPTGAGEDVVVGPGVKAGAAGTGSGAEGAGGGRPGRIVGTVIDGVEGGPIEAALVEVVRDSARALTDAHGRFALRDVGRGLLRLRVTRVGFDPVEDTVRVGAGEFVQTRLAMGPVTLAPLVVTARRTGRLADVYWRMANAIGGTFVTAADIARVSPRVPTDALRGQPGVHLIGSGSGRGGRLYLRTPCAPTVYLDGVQITHATNGRSDAAMTEAYGAVNTVHPSSIDVIEVYRGAPEVPAAFGGSGGACGAVAIWTKRGE